MRLEPPVCKLDEFDHILPERQEDWLIEQITRDRTVVLSNVTTGHKIELGSDHLYSYHSDPSRSKGGERCGFLTLKVQIYVKGGEAWFRPTVRPGEALPPSTARHHQISWTPPVRLDISGVVPPTAISISVQYRLWSDHPDVPLLLRLGCSDYHPSMLEYSGPAGVAEMMLHGEGLYASFSHPKVSHKLTVIGWEDGL